MKKTGKVYIIGAGPGDPGLITVKGAECLGRADVVVYDHLANAELLFHTAPEARVVYAGKTGGEHTLRQEEINALLIAEAREGRVVARLKGGDPFVFGRGGEEAEELGKAGISYEVVPGVTSAVAAPAYAGIPLTHRRYASSISLVTGHEMGEKQKGGIDWPNLAAGETLVCFMAMRNLRRIVARLLEAGKDAATPAALIRWGTTAAQETLVAPLGAIVRQAEERGFQPPAIMVAGQVVNLRKHLNWFETKPLFGRGVVITRPREQAAEFAGLLRAEGARVISFPTIKIIPTEDWQRLDEAIEQIETYAWIILTSANGAGFFLKRLRALGRDIRDLKGIGICAIGPATAAVLEERGIKVDMVPEKYIAESVVEAFEKQPVAGRRVLLPRAETARDVIPEGLAGLGAQVDVVTVYRTVLSDVRKEELAVPLAEGEVDVITFTSPSTVANFMAIMGGEFRLPPQVKIACIGPVTAAAAAKAGMQTHIMHEPYTVPGLAEGLVHYFRGR